jgi:hypothetical protein
VGGEVYPGAPTGSTRGNFFTNTIYTKNTKISSRMANRKKYCRLEAARLSAETGLAVQTVLQYWSQGKEVVAKQNSFSNGPKTERFNGDLAVLASLNRNLGYSFTLREIGEIVGVTHERIRQIEHDALKRLRRVASTGAFTK